MSWKNVDKFSYDPIVLETPGINLNGALHWLCQCKDEAFTIAALDLATEKFLSGFLPPESSLNAFESYMFGVAKGRLCLLQKDAMMSETCVFWTMEKYGVKESWTGIKITTLFATLRPLGYSKSEKLLISIKFKTGEMVKLNLRKGKGKSLLVNSMAIPFFADLYVESLVSPKSNDYILQVKFKFEK